MKRKLVWRVLAALILLLCVAAVFWLHRPAQLPEPTGEIYITIKWDKENAIISPRTESAFFVIPTTSDVYSQLVEHFYRLELRHSPFSKVEHTGFVRAIVSFGHSDPEIYLCAGAECISLDGTTMQVIEWKSAADRSAWFEKFYALLEQAEEYIVN